MSDDTKALVMELRCAAENTFIAWRSIAKDAADTIERLERDRDALAERSEKLREALRDATQIVEQYVAHNPTWTNGIGKTQDPMGAHALLSRMLLLAAPKDAP